MLLKFAVLPQSNFLLEIVFPYFSQGGMLNLLCKTDSLTQEHYGWLQGRLSLRGWKIIYLFVTFPIYKITVTSFTQDIIIQLLKNTLKDNYASL